MAISLLKMAKFPRLPAEITMAKQWTQRPDRHARFVDIHATERGIDFMDASKETIAPLRIRSFKKALQHSWRNLDQRYDPAQGLRPVKSAIDEVPSLGGIHLEVLYHCEIQGRANPLYARIGCRGVFQTQEISGSNIRYLTLAPEKPSDEFIKSLFKRVTVSLVIAMLVSTSEEAIKCGLTYVNHTHNAMSGQIIESRRRTAAFILINVTEFISMRFMFARSVEKLFKIIVPIVSSSSPML
jgi:N-acetylglucosamine-6-phosphate deacetylase